MSERRLKDAPLTLDELPKHYAVSRERIGQIEELAFRKVQKAMKVQVANRRSHAVVSGFRFLSVRL